MEGLFLMKSIEVYLFVHCKLDFLYLIQQLCLGSFFCSDIVMEKSRPHLNIFSGLGSGDICQILLNWSVNLWSHLFSHSYNSCSLLYNKPLSGPQMLHTSAVNANTVKGRVKQTKKYVICTYTNLQKLYNTLLISSFNFASFNQAVLG